MNSSDIYRSLGCGLAAALLSTTATSAFAQAGSANGAESEVSSGEILVTARRYSESLQDTPITITVLTQTDIENRGIESVGDFANLTSNVTFNTSLGLGGGFLTIRGQTQSRFAPPPAAIVVDGVLQMLPSQFNVDQFDVSQIEVLKGPQGAIYGKNAIAGAINITTVKPSNEFRAKGLVGYARGDDFKAQASVSGPIVEDKLFALVGLSYKDRRGQIQNITNGAYSDKFYDFSQRARIVATPVDDLELDVKYTHSKSRGQDPQFIVSSTNDPRRLDDPYIANRVGTNPRNLHEASGKLSYDFGGMTAIASLAYVNVKEQINQEIDYTPFDISDATQDQRDVGFSQELRLTSNSDGPLHFTVGAYRSHTRSSRELLLLVDPFFLGIPGFPAPTAPVFPLGANENIYRTNSWAAFGQFGYEVTPELRLDFDLRYDHERVKLETIDFLAATTANDATSFSKVQPKATVTYRPSDDLTLYGSAGRGFRTGDFNPGVRTFGDDILKAETATTYELGVKARLLDRMLSLSAAVFQTDLKNGQFQLFDLVAVTSVGVNTEKSRMRGLELEASFRPSDMIGINASFGYVDAKVLDFVAPAGFLGSADSVIGKSPQRTPKVTANLGFDLTVPINDRLSVFLRPQYRYTGRYYWDPENLYPREPEHTVNIRGGFSGNENIWALTAYVDNVLNEKITPDYQPVTVTGSFLGLDVYYPALGSVYGVELSFRF